MNEFDKNKSIETLLEETAEQIQPNVMFKAELEEKLRKAHKPGNAISLPRFNNLSIAFTGVLVLAGLIAFMVWLFQSLEPQKNFGGDENYSCPVTEPNGSLPPGETVTSAEYLGNGELWTVLWPEGKVIMEPNNVEADGSLSMKWGFYRGVTGELTVEGRRLDAEAQPLRADIPDGYGDTGFQVTGLIFPTPGCWEVTARVGDSSLTFVIEVIYSANTTPTPGVIIDPNATPSDQSVGGYDFRGGKLFLSQPLPISPDSANIYTYIEDKPVTLEEAQAFADQFGIKGELYKTGFPQDPNKTGYVITDGKQMLTVYTANYYVYIADILVNNRGYFGAPSNNAEETIADFFKQHNIDFPYELYGSAVDGTYYIHQLAPDGMPMQYDTFAMQNTKVILGKDGEVAEMDSNRMSYQPTAIGNYGIISSQDALDAILGDNPNVGMMETGSGSPLASNYAPQQWFREYPNNQTVSISGTISKYESADNGQPPLILIDGVPVLGNIGELETKDDHSFVQVTGQFVVENEVSKFNIETVDQNVTQAYITGSLTREGDQIILTSDDGANQYVVLDAPEDLPLNTEIGKSYLAIMGILTDNALDWSAIQYVADASSMGGGGGGGGSGFYQLNLTGTPIPFPTPSVAGQTYTQKELAGFLRYNVQSGDTLDGIASQFGIPVADLMSVNYMTDPSTLQEGWVLIIPGVPGAARLDGEEGMLQINLFKKPDGRQRYQYVFINKNDGSNYEMQGNGLDALNDYNNQPITVWGTLSYDDNGLGYLNLEKFEPTYPGLRFQILKGKERSQDVNGTSVLLFTTEGATYVILSRDGGYPDLNYKGDFPEDVSIEALIIPGETYAGYPALRLFNLAPQIDPSTQSPVELPINADKPIPMPDPYGNGDTYIQPDFVVDRVELEYYISDPKILADPGTSADGQYIQPVWHFHGHYTSGSAEIDILVQALKQEFLAPFTEPLPQGG